MIKSLNMNLLVDEDYTDEAILARDLDIKMLETVSRVLIGSGADKLSTAELKRDILVFSRNYPEEFIDVLNPFFCLSKRTLSFNVSFTASLRIYFPYPL